MSRKIIMRVTVRFVVGLARGVAQGCTVSRACGGRGFPATKTLIRGELDEFGRKISNEVEGLKGKAKEAVGNAKGDESLKAEGQSDQGRGNMKQAGEEVKDAFTR